MVLEQPQVQKARGQCMQVLKILVANHNIARWTKQDLFMFFSKINIGRQMVNLKLDEGQNVYNDFLFPCYLFRKSLICWSYVHIVLFCLLCFCFFIIWSVFQFAYLILLYWWIQSISFCVCSNTYFIPFNKTRTECISKEGL